MQLTSIARAATVFALLAGTFAAQAADFAFSGRAVLNTDIVRIGFDLNSSAVGVRLWTDSWKSGVNFDPTIALWSQQGSDYVLVAQNDDDNTIGAGQGFFDSGLAPSALTAGHYLVTLGASPNIPTGNLLSQGFGFDPAYGPIASQPISQWMQPSYDPNANDQKGTLWSLNLSGVSGASLVSSVPEPSSVILAVLGLGVIGLARRRAR